MIVTCVHVKVKKELIDAFKVEIIKNFKGTRQETGNLRFDVLQEENDPQKFMIYEVFASEEAVLAHKETAHYLAWRDAVESMMDEKRFGTKYKVIAPQEKELW